MLACDGRISQARNLKLYCAKGDVDDWFDNEHVAVHWWEVITSTATTSLLPMLVESFSPTMHNFVGILDVSSPAFHGVLWMSSLLIGERL